MDIIWPNKVFITGASGFIGRKLAERLEANGVATCGVDMVADPSRGVVAGNIAEAGDWARTLEGCDLVVHTAAIVAMTASKKAAWTVNVNGTRRVLDAAVAARVARFVQISSVAAFGWDFPESATEEWPLMPNGNSYCDTKIASEHVVLAAHAAGEIDCTVVRPGDVYGPRSVWITAPLAMLKKGQFMLPDGGNGVFSPVWVDDLVDGVIRAGCINAGKGQIFTITSGEGVPCSEFFGNHARWLGKKKVPTAPSWLLNPALETARVSIQTFGGKTDLGRGTMDILNRRCTYSIEKARRLLGYEPKMRIEDGMRICEAWARETGLVPARIRSAASDMPKAA